ETSKELAFCGCSSGYPHFNKRTDKRVAQYLLRPFLYSTDYDSTMLIAVKWRENAHRRAIFTFF
ncbi:TPA: hypothetical protein ACGHVK_004927, partial [Salmonella enterica subsp. enterica serovar Bovismorbificans]